MANILDDFPLDIFGQQPSLNLYTQLSLCYPLEPTIEDSTVINSLSQGLKRLSDNFPWVAGQVVHEGGVFKIKPLENAPRLVVKDLRNDPSISFSALREASFPASMLDENAIAPRKTLTMLEPDAKDLPVFVAQANFVAGGLILTFVGHHQTLDLVGQVHIMSLLAKLCRGEEITEEERSAGNINRKDVIPLLGPSYTPGPEVAHLRPPSPNPEEVPAEAPSSPPKSAWGSFLFSPSSLSSLKSFASSTLPSDCPFISTDDALSALIYRHVARSRLPRLSPTTTTKYTRAVDVRPYIPSIPPTYPGMAQSLVHFRQSLGSLAQDSLGSLAAKARAAVDPKTSNIAYTTRAMATLLDRAEDKSIVGFTGPIDPSSDFMLSSWAKAGAYSLDYGFGRPEAVRRPQFTPFEGLGYLIPKRPDGEIAVMICLQDEDLERLKADEEFVKFGKFIG